MSTLRSAGGMASKPHKSVHKPDPVRNAHHGEKDGARRAVGPGERPGVPSRIEAARARIKEREG